MLSSSLVKQLSLGCGFDACGMAPAGAMPLFDAHLRRWIAEGCQADMRYMSDNLEIRCDPTLLVPGAKSVISLLVGYKPTCRVPGIAMYAYGEDYHERLKGMLFSLIAAIKEHYPSFEAKPCVDTVPITDKLWAWRCGLGWIGKNTLLIHPLMGSLCFIAELVTTSECDAYDTPMENRCGDCSLCLDSCPNQALSTEGGLCASRCTSYNTIENRSATLPDSLNTKGYCFGCDLCQLSCPFNRDVEPSLPISEARQAELESLYKADEATFRRLIKHSSINRIKYPQWLRNVKHLQSPR